VAVFLAIEYRDGVQSAQFELKAGQVDWDEPTDRIHRAVNVGTQPYEDSHLSFSTVPTRCLSLVHPKGSQVPRSARPFQRQPQRAVQCERRGAVSGALADLPKVIDRLGDALRQTWPLRLHFGLTAGSSQRKSCSRIHAKLLGVAPFGSPCRLASQNTINSASSPAVGTKALLFALLLGMISFSQGNERRRRRYPTVGGA
jgi:hypothetical protein